MPRIYQALTTLFLDEISTKSWQCMLCLYFNEKMLFLIRLAWEASETQSASTRIVQSHLNCFYLSWTDMSMDPKVGYMIREHLSTKCSIGSMIQSDPMVKFYSRSWIPLDPSLISGTGSWIPSDPWWNWWYRIYDLRKLWIQADPSHILGFN